MKVWVCEMVQAGFTIWRWLCKACALARRAQRQRGNLLWLSVTPLRVIDADCADCYRKAHAGDRDDAAELRKTRAATRDPDHLVRMMIGGKLIERRSGDFATIPNAGDAT